MQQGGESSEHISETPASTEHHERGGYEIRIKGHLDSRWADWFAGLSFTHESDGTTTLTGPVIDQAALHGLLRKASDLGLTLVSVMQLDPNEATEPAVDTARQIPGVRRAT